MNYTITNPRGIDFTIQKLQKYLKEKLDWGEIEVYGRVYKNPSKNKGISLEAYVGKNEYKDIFTNDSKNASIFFIDDDKHKSKDGIIFKTGLKIVFMVNLKKILPEANHRADMDVEIQAIELLQKKSTFTFESIEKGVDEVLGKFNTEQLKTDNMHPFHVFSVSGEVTYQISCLTN